MSNQWLIPVLLAALVGSGATAMGFVLGGRDSPALTAPIALPGDCAPVACEPVDCEPVACVDPRPPTEQVTPDSRASRMRRGGQGTTQVLNPWDNDPSPNVAPTAPTSAPPSGESTMSQGSTKVLNTWD